MASEPERKLDYSDYVATPDDGKCYQIVGGDLYVTPSPRPVHQRISRRLQRMLEDHFDARSIGEVFNAPIDLILSSHDILVPDLLVVADPQQVTDRGVEGPPLVIVEILSPSTRKQDLGVKARRYAALGVPHYWIVDPDGKRLECRRLVDGAYRVLVEAAGEGALSHPEWEELSIDLGALWRPGRVG